MKANALIGVTLVALLGCAAAVDAQVYRWEDEKGQVHYSNIRPSPPAPREAPAPPKEPEPARQSEPEAARGPETVKGPEPKTSTPAAQARPEQAAPIEEILKATSPKKQERMGGFPMTAGFLMKLGFIILAIILSLIGNIWLIVVGFKQSVLWGLLMLFFSPSQGLFIFKYWQEAKRPFLVEVAGAAVAVIALLMGSVS
ncbi:MAG: DUF4124 domain-containing protein [candidate division NC10 bacterium]|nr:DUF4124 domain-containing protein [candidate division NC10 bacterium]